MDVFSILLGINLGIEFLSHPKLLNIGFKVSVVTVSDQCLCFCVQGCIRLA